MTIRKTSAVSIASCLKRLSPAALGCVLLLAWIAWWCASLAQPVPRLLCGEKTWILHWPFIGLDFIHSHTAANCWLHGGNPYVNMQGDGMFRTYMQAPIVLFFFAWSYLFQPNVILDTYLSPDHSHAIRFVTSLAAIRTWTTVVGLLIVIAAWLAWRDRQELESETGPSFIWALIIVLWTSPVIFAMERGNWDVLAVSMVLLGVWAMRRRSSGGDAIAGACFALAIWIKVYPGILLVGLVLMRRFRVAIWTAALGSLILVGLWRWNRLWIEGLSSRVGVQSHAVLPYGHSLTSAWAVMFQGTPLEPLGRIPGMAAAGVLLLPLIIWTGLHVWRGRQHDRIALGYLLWLVAVGTFVPRIAYDYNMIWFPLAMVVLWSRRDPWFVHALLAPAVLAYQPVRLPFPPVALLVFKLIGMVGLASCLAERLRSMKQRRAIDENACYD